MSLEAMALGFSEAWALAVDVGFLGEAVAIEYSVLRSGVSD
jgi:hypothetical protein